MIAGDSRPDPAASRRDVLDTFAETLRQLITDYGVSVDWADLGDDIGHWDGPHRHVTIDRSASLADQAWLALQVLQLCAFGQHAVPDGVPGRPNLRAVR